MKLKVIIYVGLITLLTSTFTLTQENQLASNQQQLVVGGPSQAGEPVAAGQPASPRRIVDPKKFPPKSSLPARILLAPFRPVGRGLEQKLNRLERTGSHNRLLMLKNPYIRPLIGGLGDGSGFGGGAYLSSANAISERFKVFASAHVTSKQYLTTGLGFHAEPVRNFRKLSVELAGRYQLRPQEDFWGLGPRSFKADRSTYDLQERGVRLMLDLHIRPSVHLGTGLDYSSSRIFGGEDARFPTTQPLFGATNLPGLAEGAALLGAFTFAEFDNRNSVGNPTSGAFVRFTVMSNDSVGRSDFGFWNYLLDARGYVPLGIDRRVFAVRMLANFNDPKGGSQIPFFRLARLGDATTLRGYDTYRFYGRNAVAWNFEYRWRFASWISAVGFTDLGQVFDSGSQFNTANLRVTFGGGAQFHSRRAVVLRTLIGKSDEAVRFFVNFGPTF